MATQEIEHSADFDPTAGSLHCLQLNGRYLVRVEERQGIDEHQNATTGYVLEPIRNLSRELIPLLKINGGSPIERDDFITTYRDLHLGDSKPGVEAKIFDVSTNKKEIAAAIIHALEEGTGLALVTEGQIRNGGGIAVYDGKLEGNYQNPRTAHITVDDWDQAVWNRSPDKLTALGVRLKTDKGIPDFQTSPVHELLPVSTYFKGENREAVASFACRSLLLPRIHAEPAKNWDKQMVIPDKRMPNEKITPVEIAENLYQNIKKSILSVVEGQDNGNEYRLTEKDFADLRKHADKKLVDDLERSVVVNRLLILGIKAIRGVDAGAMVSTGKLPDPNVANAARLISSAILIGTNGLQRGFEKNAVKSVSELLGKILNNILINHRDDIITYEIGKDEAKEEEDPEIYFRNRAGVIARDLGKAEEISPFTIEMTPGQIAMNGVLLYAQEYVPMLINAAMVGGTWVGMKLARLEIGDKLIKSILSHVTDIGAAVISNAPALAGVVIPALRPDWANNEALYTSIALVSNQSSEQIGGADEIADGESALKEMRRFLRLMNLALPTEEMKREHGLRILATEDAGPATVTYGKLGEAVLRYQLLDDDEAKIPKSRYSTEGRVYPLLSVRNFTARAGETVFLENQDMILRWGNIMYLISPEAAGKTLILKGLADEIDHPTGTLLLRQQESDYNVHGESGRRLVRYFDCSGRSKKVPDLFADRPSNIDSFKKSWREDLTEEEKTVFKMSLEKHHSAHLEDAQALIACFKEYKLFTDAEILAILNKEKVGRAVRSRLWAVAAGWSKARVVLLDDPFANDLSTNEMGRFWGNLRHVIDVLDGKDEDSNIDISIDVMCEFLGLDKTKEKAEKIRLLRAAYDTVRPTANLANFIASQCSMNDQIVMITSNKDENASGYLGVLKTWSTTDEIYRIKDRKLVKVELRKDVYE